MALTRQRSRTDGHWWYRTVLIVTLVTSSLALLLQFIGFVMPGWIVLTLPSGMYISAGVWYIQVCDAEGRCRTASMTTGVNPFNVAGDTKVEFMSWIEVQVELTLAFVAAIVCVIMSVNVLINLTDKPRSFLGWSTVAAVLSVVLLLIPVGRLIEVILQWDSYIRYEVPYALICSGLGGLFCCVTVVLNACAMCMIMCDMRKERLNSDETDDLTRTTL